MTKISENIYNKNLRRDQSKLKLWRHAGLMLTYKCNAKCSFCYYNCSPDKDSLMPIDTAISAWQSLKSLSPDNASVHITGGEPFLYFEHLLKLLEKASAIGLTPPDSIETNAFWATDDKTITKKIKLLDDAGMDKLKISWDPFHAEFIDIGSVRRLARTAADILGANRILVRWEKYLKDPVKMRNITDQQRVNAYKTAINDFPCRFTGRAAGKPAELFAEKNTDSLSHSNCAKTFLNAKGVHIDPYGNVFSGQCSGIIIGNINKTPLKTIWKQFDPLNHQFIATLFKTGPCGLLSELQTAQTDYRQKKYASKCHLCTKLRQFFFDIGQYSSIIGPCQCYT